MTDLHGLTSGPRGPVLIARCPEHGLHGERTECFVCGGPVEQVPMITVDLHDDQFEDMVSEIELLREHYVPRWRLTKIQAEHKALREAAQAAWLSWRSGSGTLDQSDVMYALRAALGEKP